MDTVRLRHIQEPSGVERLLEAYVLRTNLLPDGSYRLRDTRELPPGLRIVATRTIRLGQVWSCWARGSQAWLWTCEMSLPLSRERGAPVLLVRRYAEDGELTESGAWSCDRLGTWSRCAD